MKFLVLILGSTTLVAGGTAITSQQDARNNVTAHQRPYQEHRASSRGTDCPPVAIPIFDNVAHPLFVENPDCSIGYLSDMDVDGDGIPDTSVGFFQKDDWSGDCSKFHSIGSMDKKSYYVPGSNPPEVVTESYLDLNPDSMTYEGFDLIYTCYMNNNGYLDVTNDGKPDAIIRAYITTECNEPGVSQYFYVENISEWTAACATDINNDGSTNVTDLLAVVGNWGACP